VSTASILVVGVSVVLALPLVARALQRRFDPFEPIVVFALAYGVMFVARPVSMLAHGELTSHGVDIRNTLPVALLLALAGAVAFVAGYESRVGRTLARALPRPRELTVRAGVVGSTIMIGLAFVAFLVTVWPAGGYRRFTVLVNGQTAEVIQLTVARGAFTLMVRMLVVPAAMLLLALALRERRRGLSVAAALAVAVALLFTVPVGARTFVLPLVAGGLTLAYVNRGARPRVVTVVALAMIAFVASYVVLTVREPARRSHMTYYVQEFTQRPWVVFSPVIEGGDAEMAPALAGALRVVPSRLHYRYGGALFGDLALRPIPRLLWSGKPKASQYRIIRTVWPRLVKDRFQPEFSVLLVFYWDFGIAGVVAGMAILGIVCRTLYDWFLRYQTNLAAQVIFATSLWLVVAAVRYDPVQSIVLAGVLVGPLILVERCSSLHLPMASSLRARARLSQK
jgi:hypothetical protein